jgi:hypothetical protein
MTKQNSSLRTLQPSWFDRLAPLTQDLLCTAVLLGLIFAIFQDIIFNNMVFSTAGDTAAAHSWAKAIEHIEQTEHISPLWIPYIFGGIPIASSLLFPVNVNYLETILHAVGRIVFLGAELHWFVLHYFLMGLSMYLLARQLNFTSIPSLIAAVTVMLNPYAIGLAQGGHGSKLMTLSIIPFFLLFTINLFQRRDLLSLGLLSAALGTLLLNRHPQIAFYGLLFVGCYALYDVFLTRREPSRALVNLLLFVVAIAIGFALYMYEFLPTQEYAQYSIRGGGEAGAGGLSYDYATNWSFHPMEMLNYLIPSFFGFESPYYWGWMPFTDTTVYVGIVPVLFGILALVYARRKETIFLVLFSAFILLIAFGKHLPIVYDLLFNYLPYFNKFRAPSMILHVMPMTVGLLAAYGYTAFTNFGDRLQDIYLAPIRKRFMICAAIVGAILVIGFIGNTVVFDITSGSMFQKPEGDELPRLIQQQYNLPAANALQAAKRIRFDILGKDYVKFAIITGAAIGLIVLYLKRTFTSFTLGLGMLTILAVDLLIISTKFINPKPRADFERAFIPDATVKFLKSDTSLYRIYPVGNLFMDNTWMYHTIPSIGGYSPAKVKIFQEMIDSVGLHPPKLPLNMNILNMLNVKYVVVPGQLPETEMRLVNMDQTKRLVTYENPRVLPRAWFVDDVIVASTRSEVFDHLNSSQFQPARQAILEKSPARQPMKSDSTAVRMKSFGTHKITLNTFCTNPSLLVLSEVYYPAGWKASIDGAETEIYKTNYVLRSVLVPAGTHTVEFVFEPSVYNQGLLITNAAWGVTALLILIGLYRVPIIRGKFSKKRTVPLPSP